MKMERSLIVAKPETVQAHLIGELISRFEKMGMKIIGMKMVHPDEAHVELHYPYSTDLEKWAKWGRLRREILEKRGEPVPWDKDEEYGKLVIDRLRKHISESPVVAFVIEGPEAIAFGRKIIGATDPIKAAPGTFRGDFTCDKLSLAEDDNRSVKNLVHASDSDNAEAEIKLWFKPEELFNWESPLQKTLLKL